MTKRADAEGRWDLVADALRERLTELRWDGRRKTLPQALGGINEHSARRLYDGEPYNHADAVRRTASMAVGWAPDGIDRLAVGDRSGAEVAAPAPSASLRAGTGSADLWDQLTGEAATAIDLQRRGAEAALGDMLARQLRDRDVRIEVPGRDQPRADFILYIGDRTVAVVETKSIASGGRDALYAGLGQLITHRRHLDGNVAAILVVDLPPEPDDLAEVLDQGVIVVTPDDWTPLDTLKASQQPVDDG